MLIDHFCNSGGDFAKRVGVSHTMVRRLKNNEQEISLRMANKIVSAFPIVNKDWILGRSELMFIQEEAPKRPGFNNQIEFELEMKLFRAKMERMEEMLNHLYKVTFPNGLKRLGKRASTALKVIKSDRLSETQFTAA